MGRLVEMLRQNSESGAYPLHMPGHKRAWEWNINPYKYDITETEGFDDLHRPTGVLAELNGRLAAKYGADEAFLTVNGSTSGVLAAVSAAAESGGMLLLDRNSHRSAYNAAFLRRLRTEYIYPQIDCKTGIAEGYSHAQVGKILREKPGIQAVYVTSPTYEGVVLDIKKIAETVHAYGLPLIVDAAHGAHLGLYRGFPDNPLSEGADVVVMSLHKTLPVFTQTAVICLKGGRVSAEKLRRYFDIYVSTSPSYLLMASAERCMDFLDSEGEAAFAKYRERLCRFRSECEALKHLYLWKYDGTYDFGKLVICTDKSSLSGQRLSELLRERYGLEVELASAAYVLAMTSCMDGHECYERLLFALKEIDSECGEAGLSGNAEAMPVPTRVQKLCEAWEAEGMEYVRTPLSEAAGGVSADYVYVYPPGVPWLVPGEIIDENAVRRIEEYMDRNIEVRGVEKDGGIKILTDLHKKALNSDIYKGL
ncbi:MAG: aminotransferase class I/II-fold pyridoxal phosphate-dependent enzyme [Butyrivibrio sp.]|nr:aminotransferase class I/II-fold pyridoxal phosphate-dependent enzyme [Butyrivibrio sp.]